MNVPPKRISLIKNGLIVLLSLLASSSPLKAQKTWRGTSADGSNGSWGTTANWSPTGVPSSTSGASNQVRFLVDADNPQANSTVTVAGARQATLIEVGRGKTVVLNLNDAASLTTGNGISRVGNALGTGTGAASLTLQGPATGSGTANLGRILVTNGSSIEFSGAITVTDVTGGADTDIGYSQSNNTMTISGGAKVTRFSTYLTSGAGGTSGDRNNNELRVTGTGSQLIVDNTGLAGNVGLRVGTTLTGTADTYATAAHNNHVIIEKGGKVSVVTQGSTNINFLAIGARYARSNYVQVTGSNSLLELQGASRLQIGEAPGLSLSQFGGNYLLVEAGGKVTTDGTTTILGKPTGTTNDGVNRLTIGAGGTFSSSSIITVNGLLQLAEGGALDGNGAALNVDVTSGGRFEAAGTGLAANVSTSVKAGATLAVGLENTTRTQAVTLTLQSTASFIEGSFLEISLFEDGAMDSIHFLTGGALTGDIILNLNVNTLTPVPGQSWTVFSGDTTLISADFDLSGLNPAIWDVSRFDAVGGWKLSVIPEPGMVSLIFFGCAMMLVARRHTARKAASQ